MPYEAASPQEYIQRLPKERQKVISKVRDTILQSLPKGFEEQMGYNMLGYVVPHTIYPKGYHCDTRLTLPFINLASQKNFVALYYFGIYPDKTLLDWFIKKYPKHCKRKLDMGKSCIRFKYMNDIPYELISELCGKMSVKDWTEIYEKNVKR